MAYVTTERKNEIAILTLHRGKVNAINGDMIRELSAALESARTDGSVRALILTGHGSFFSFGLDVPGIYPLSPEECGQFLTAFTDLYTDLYLFPKPTLAAVNGHAIAGGCMLALACDRRWMAAGKGKIALNEVTFGSSLFAGSVEMLCRRLGQRAAEEVALQGTLYAPEEARAIGLIDRVLEPEELLPQAIAKAQALGARDPAAFASIKGLLRRPVAETMRAREEASIREFIEIWYSESTRAQLRKIVIREA